MPIRVSSTAFFRYLAAQSTTRVSKVREAKKMVMTPAEDYKRVDYWKTLREESIRFLTGSSNSREFSTAIEGVTDEKKVSNYKASAAGLRRWLGRKRVTAQAVQSVIWSHAGLEVVVAPELILSWPGGGPYVVKLYFSADPLSKYLANPMLRLLEQTHGESPRV